MGLSEPGYRRQPRSDSQVPGLDKWVGWRRYRRKTGLKDENKSAAMMRVRCLWETQVEFALEVVENIGLDPDVGLQAHRELGSHGAGCHDAGVVWN